GTELGHEHDGSWARIDDVERRDDDLDSGGPSRRRASEDHGGPQSVSLWRTETEGTASWARAGDSLSLADVSSGRRGSGAGADCWAIASVEPGRSPPTAMAARPANLVFVHFPPPCAFPDVADTTSRWPSPRVVLARGVPPTPAKSRGGEPTTC